ncbi:hypothetical protein [Treponema phagedenis]|uniref:hypothetical protein n=1 Tax=Treponema phagedenis TaxID=162 RepID=UPI002091A9A4|nr:hypothetical protein [Treponema phagedenis]
MKTSVQWWEGSIWKSDFLSFKNGTAIKSFGAGAAVRGVKFRQYRPDLIILMTF